MNDMEFIAFASSLADQFAVHARSIIGPEPAFHVLGAEHSPAGVNVLYDVVPGPVRPAVGKFDDTGPDRTTLLEMLARTYRVRSRRVDRTTWTIPPVPRDWETVLETHFPMFRGSGLEVGDGWADLLIATADWLSESQGDFHPFSQIKEKFGGLRIYGLMSGEAQTITDAASWLSMHICDRCGAPGTKNRSGWIATRCGVHRHD